MTTITLDVPDDLAARLRLIKTDLPRLLSIALDLFTTDSSLTTSATKSNYAVFEEMINFLAGSPTSEQILAFKISPAAQARLQELLDKNSEATLSEDETAELDAYEQVNHTLLLLKARTRSTLSTTLL